MKRSEKKWREVTWSDDLWRFACGDVWLWTAEKKVKETKIYRQISISMLQMYTIWCISTSISAAMFYSYGNITSHWRLSTYLLSVRKNTMTQIQDLFYWTKYTKNWYTIDALGAIFVKYCTFRDTFTILFFIILKKIYLKIFWNIVDTIYRHCWHSGIIDIVDIVETIYWHCWSNLKQFQALNEAC